MQSNDELESLHVSSQVTELIQVSKAPKMHLQTYRARGHMNPYVNPCSHIEVILLKKNRVLPRRKRYPRRN